MRGIAGADPQDPNRGADLGGAAAEVGLCEGGEVGVRGDDAGEEVRVDDRVLDVSAVRSRADKRYTPRENIDTRTRDSTISYIGRLRILDAHAP